MSTDAKPQNWSATAEAYKHFEAFTGGFARDAVDMLLKAPAIRALLEASAAGPDAAPVKVLDIAAGTGAACFAFAEAAFALVPGAKLDITATDLSDKMLEGLRAHPRLAALQERVPAGALTLRAEAADMMDLAGVGSGTVDVALCVFGIMFPPDPAKALREIGRVLRPGVGVASIVTWHYNNGVQIIGDICVALGKVESEDECRPALLNFGDEAFLRRLLRHVSSAVSLRSLDFVRRDEAAPEALKSQRPGLRRQYPLKPRRAKVRPVR